MTRGPSDRYLLSQLRAWAKDPARREADGGFRGVEKEVRRGGFGLHVTPAFGKLPLAECPVASKQNILSYPKASNALAGLVSG